ncbi:sulfotransferase family protein [Pelagicoccus albus]|uniref:Sulfotransferase n=1 Tax=Pelagicoccus albus TaxID=415222 RepID=A0A7X1E830_9BACT|nr:sulfotransferase [Pelagicoccus albus]MBC2605826.1 sulfotransferase [Pelagicoccus albus]
MAKLTIKRRIFIVGTPRSGTTLLQSLLASHPLIHSVPETHFFYEIRKRKRDLIPWANRSNKKRWKSTCLKLSELWGTVGIDPKFEREKFPSRVSCIQYFVSLLDRLAFKESKPIWLEKTPRHLHYIETISNSVPDAIFIHLLRDGESTARSIAKAAESAPETWGPGSRYSTQSCLDRWRSDLDLHLKYVGNKKHYFTNYESLVQKPKDCLQSMCSFIGVAFEESQLTGYRKTAEQLINSNESWKSNTSQNIGYKQPNDQEIKSETRDEYCQFISAVQKEPSSQSYFLEHF